jgi:glyoxylase-like metal-dependent hydrolase (beta-lactamase superfamily II)
VGPIETFEGQHDLFGDGRLTLIPAPGHTPGMTVAHVALERDGAFVLTSDAIPVRACLDQHYAPRNSWDMDLSMKALDEVGRLQADGAEVLFGHDDAQWSSLRRGEAFYE